VLVLALGIVSGCGAIAIEILFAVAVAPCPNLHLDRMPLPMTL